MLDPDAGARTLATLQDEATTAQWRRTLDAVAPGFDAWVVAAVFGGTYQRPGLTARERQLVTLAALVTLGGVDPQLDGHLRSGLRLGLDTTQLAEVFVHLVPYVGLPRVMAALRRLAAVRDAESQQ